MDPKVLQTWHDRLLAEMPEGATHNQSVCPVCSAKEVADDGGQVVAEPKTYSEEEVRAEIAKAVAEATASVQTEIAELRTQLDTAKAGQEADEKAQLESKIEELQTQLDAKTLEAQAAATELAAVKAWLEGEAEEAEKAKVIEAKKDERKSAVAEVASFPEDYVAQNEQRWAEMADEQFAAYLEDLKVVAAKTTGDSTIPSKTAMTAAAEGGKPNGRIGSALSAVREFREQGVDPRQLA